MPKNRMLHTTLALTAIVGFGLFILACTGWLSWNPDGSQILFGYYDRGVEEYRVAIYDLGRGKLRTLNPKELNSKEERLFGQWKQDGTGLFLFQHDSSSTLRVLDVDATSGAINRETTVPVKEQDTSILIPAVEMQSSLYINTKPFTRLDLATLQFQQSEEQEDAPPFVFSFGNSRLLYLLGRESSDEFEFGFVDPQTLALNRLFGIKSDDTRLRKSKALRALMAPEPGGSRLAIASWRSKKDDIIICSETGIQRVLSPRFSFPIFHIGNLQWSSDGKHLYGSVITSLREKFVQYSVAEIDIESGHARTIPIAEINTKGESEFDELFYLALQVWVSPDQHTIATSTANLDTEMIADKDRALYLVDMSRQDQKVTKIPAPVSKKKEN